MNIQPIPSEQVKTGKINFITVFRSLYFVILEKGHKKAKEEEMRAIKSKVMSLPSTPPNPRFEFYFSI